MASDLGGLTGRASGVRRKRPYLPVLGIAAATGWLVWFGAATLMRSGRLDGTLGAGWVELAGPAFVLVVLAAVICEQVWPAQPRRLLARGHVQDACFFVVYAGCVVPVMTLLGVAFARILGTHAGWIEARWTASWPLWLVVTLTLVGMDAANWLAHWADHRLKVLWRLHAVHHSQDMKRPGFDGGSLVWFLMPRRAEI